MDIDKLSYKLFTEFLSEQLQKPLKGNLAHRQMMPEGRDLLPFPKHKIKQSAVLIAFYKHNNSWVFPLIKRAEYDGVHSGQMALPGGKFEEIDKNLHNTALREAKEEIGIVPENVYISGELTKLQIPVSNNCVLPVIGSLQGVPKFVENAREVEKIFTIKLHDLLMPENRKNETWTINGKQLNIPIFALEGEKIWGATAMILNELTTIFYKNG